MSEQAPWQWQQEGTSWKGVGIYHLTLTVTSREPLLGSLVIPNHDPLQARVVPTELGRALLDCQRSIPVFHPEIQILQYSLMPDHLHSIWYVRRPMEKSIRYVAQGFWRAAKKAGRAYSYINAALSGGARNESIATLNTGTGLSGGARNESIETLNTGTGLSGGARNESIATLNTGTGLSGGARNESIATLNTGTGLSGGARNESIATLKTGTGLSGGARNESIATLNTGTALSGGARNESIATLNTGTGLSGGARNESIATLNTGTALSGGARNESPSISFLAPAQSRENLLCKLLGVDDYSRLAPIFTEVPFIRPLSRRGQLQAMIRYVQLNPQRLATKRLMPGFFHVQENIEIAGRKYAGVGNLLLLQAAHFATVHVRHQWVDEAAQGNTQPLRNYMNGCVLAARRGAVMVSPFISPKEKAVQDVLLAEQHPFIVLADNGFRDFYKPTDHLFDAVAAGRVLILSPWAYDAQKRHISRADCVSLNTMAEEIGGM